MSLSTLEEWVLDALLRRLRVLAVQHVEQYCQTRGFEQTAKQVLRTLKRKGLVESFTTETIVLDLPSPLFVWNQEANPSVNFSKIGWRARSRFLTAEPREHQVLMATEQAERLFGGIGGALRQPNQILHDLGTASAYLSREVVNVGLQTTWTSEDMLRRSWRHLDLKKIPDAALIVDEKIVKVIEFAGRDYGRAYLEKFHSFWKRRATSYEIW